jgi:hypothetical protein
LHVEKDKALLLPPPDGRCVIRPAVTSQSSRSSLQTDHGLVNRMYSGAGVHMFR